MPRPSTTSAGTNRFASAWNWASSWPATTSVRRSSALRDDDGRKLGLFGPVITRVPTTEQSPRLWDGFIGMATVPGFWEVKPTRTEPPDFGDRP